LAAVAFFGALALWPSPPATPVVRLNAEVSNTGLFSDVGSAVVLSPDGTLLAYVVGDGNSRSLHIRSLDRLEGSPLSGTEQSYHPFFSPDGKWVGFVTRTELKKVSISGGAPLTLADANLSRGASWGPDDTIVFAPTPGAGLSVVPAAGGEAQGLTELGEGETSHRWPQFLPDGKTVLFTSHASSSNFDDANVEAVVVATGERKVLHRGGSYARYVPSGHLVYVREGTLFGAPFDATRLEMTGSPAPILEGVISSPYHGSAQFDVARNGLLVYLGGTLDRFQYSMVWVDRDAKTLPVSADRKTFGEPHISPDGTLLAVQIHDVGGVNVDIWVYDLKRGASTRLTFQEAADVAPIWSHDGKRVAFSSDRDGAFNLYWKRADGSGEVERLTESDNTQYVSSFSPDGKYLVYHESAAGTASDLFVLPLEGDREAELFLRTPFGESEAAFSPDGRWIAYNSNESGSSEVYVRPFPAAAGKWQISTDGGVYPRWSHQGRELFYRKDDAVIVVSYRSEGESFVAETPRKLFEGAFLSLSVGGMTLADYDVGPDGKRFVMMQGEEHAQEMKVTFVFNWFEDLRRTFSSSN
jgi:serine/threonine-protein kinase